MNSSADLVIVSVHVPALDRVLDIELLSSMSIGACRDALLAKLVPERDAASASMGLAGGGAPLPPERTLAELGVWSGASLTLHLPATPQAGEAVFVGPSGRRYSVPRTGATIGRSSGTGGLVDVDLAGESGGGTVSRLHARLVFRGEQWQLIHSPEATNPTLVQGQAAPVGTPCLLSDGVSVQFGQVSMVFQIAPASQGR